jgi:hypothetical protein
MRRILILLVLAFVVTSTAIVGARMSAQAMAVVVGVVCGASAGIPVSLLILAATRRRNRYDETGYVPYARHDTRSGAYPPVVVIQGGSQPPGWSAMYGPSQLQPPFYGTAADSMSRKFHVVGDQDWEAD